MEINNAVIHANIEIHFEKTNFNLNINFNPLESDWDEI